MSKVEKDRIYECEVKRPFVDQVTKAIEWRWVLRPVKDVIGGDEAQVRCKDCHGKVKLHGRNVEHGPAPHAEHRVKPDSEYCPAGMYFRKAKDGRAPRLSSNPVT